MSRSQMSLVRGAPRNGNELAFRPIGAVVGCATGHGQAHANEGMWGSHSRPLGDRLEECQRMKYRGRRVPITLTEVVNNINRIDVHQGVGLTVMKLRPSAVRTHRRPSPVSGGAES